MLYWNIIKSEYKNFWLQFPFNVTLSIFQAQIVARSRKPIIRNTGLASIKATNEAVLATLKQQEWSSNSVLFMPATLHIMISIFAIIYSGKQSNSELILAS